MHDQMNVVEWRAGETVFEEGEISDSVYLILRGQISLIGKLNGCGEDKLIAQLGSGEILGEAAFFEDHIHNLNARASEDTEAIVMKQEEARELFYSCPAIIRKTMISLYERLHNAYIFPPNQASGQPAGKKPQTRTNISDGKKAPEMTIVCMDPQLAKHINEQVIVKSVPFTVSNSYQKLAMAKYTGNSLRIFHPRCSDFAIPHFEVTAHNESFWVRDLGSPHGTIVNGKKIHRFGQEAYAPLTVGENIVVAGTKDNNVTFMINTPAIDSVQHLPS